MTNPTYKNTMYITKLIIKNILNNKLSNCERSVFLLQQSSLIAILQLNWRTIIQLFIHAI